MDTSNSKVLWITHSKANTGHSHSESHFKPFIGRTHQTVNANSSTKVTIFLILTTTPIQLSCKFTYGTKKYTQEPTKAKFIIQGIKALIVGIIALPE